MSRKTWTIILITVGIIGIGIALWYPISYGLQKESAQGIDDRLSGMVSDAKASSDPAPEDPSDTSPAAVTPSDADDPGAALPTADAAPSAASGDTKAPAPVPSADAAPSPASAGAETAAPVIPADAAPSPAAAETEAAAPAAYADAAPSPASAGTEAAAPAASADAAPSPASAGTVAAAPAASADAAPSPASAGTETAVPAASADAASSPASAGSETAVPVSFDSGTEGSADTGAAAAAAPQPSDGSADAEDSLYAALPAVEASDAVITAPTGEEIEARILPWLREIYELNHDLIGYLSFDGIEGGQPVMQTPQDNEYYLYRDFYGNADRNGTLILEGACDAFSPCRNLIIYGHNMRSGLRFGELDRYLSRDYWEAHRIVHFDVLTEERTYVVVAVVQAVQLEGGGHGSFRYAADFEDEADLESWLDRIRRQRRYDTGVDFGTGDNYLTLSTCSYHTDNGRLLIICRELREGETADSLMMTDPGR